MLVGAQNFGLTGITFIRGQGGGKLRTASPANSKRDTIAPLRSIIKCPAKTRPYPVTAKNGAASGHQRGLIGPARWSKVLFLVSSRIALRHEPSGRPLCVGIRRVVRLIDACRQGFGWLDPSGVARRAVVLRRGLRHRRAAPGPADDPARRARSRARAGGPSRLAGAILAGGVLGPLLLMAGLAHTNAAAASLLLTLEGVATTLMAWFIFRENFDRRIALGMTCLVAGAAILVLDRHADDRRSARPVRDCRRLRRLGPRQQSDARKISLGPTADRRVERLDRRPVQLVLGLSIGASMPGSSPRSSPALSASSATA